MDDAGFSLAWSTSEEDFLLGLVSGRVHPWVKWDLVVSMLMQEFGPTRIYTAESVRRKFYSLHERWQDQDTALALLYDTTVPDLQPATMLPSPLPPILTAAPVQPPPRPPPPHFQTVPYSERSCPPSAAEPGPSSYQQKDAHCSGTGVMILDKISPQMLWRWIAQDDLLAEVEPGAALNLNNPNPALMSDSATDWDSDAIAYLGLLTRGCVSKCDVLARLMHERFPDRRPYTVDEIRDRVRSVAATAAATSGGLSVDLVYQLNQESSPSSTAPDLHVEERTTEAAPARLPPAVVLDPPDRSRPDPTLLPWSSSSSETVMTDLLSDLSRPKSDTGMNSDSPADTVMVADVPGTVNDGAATDATVAFDQEAEPQPEEEEDVAAVVVLAPGQGTPATVSGLQSEVTELRLGCVRENSPPPDSIEPDCMAECNTDTVIADIVHHMDDVPDLPTAVTCSDQVVTQFVLTSAVMIKSDTPTQPGEDHDTGDHDTGDLPLKLTTLTEGDISRNTNPEVSSISTGQYVSSGSPLDTVSERSDYTIEDRSLGSTSSHPSLALHSALDVVLAMDGSDPARTGPTTVRTLSSSHICHDNVFDDDLSLAGGRHGGSGYASSPELDHHLYYMFDTSDLRPSAISSHSPQSDQQLMPELAAAVAATVALPPTATSIDCNRDEVDFDLDEGVVDPVPVSNRRRGRPPSTLTRTRKRRRPRKSETAVPDVVPAVVIEPDDNLLRDGIVLKALSKVEVYLSSRTAIASTVSCNDGSGSRCPKRKASPGLTSGLSRSPKCRRRSPSLSPMPSRSSGGIGVNSSMETQHSIHSRPAPTSSANISCQTLSSDNLLHLERLQRSRIESETVGVPPTSDISCSDMLRPLSPIAHTEATPMRSRPQPPPVPSPPSPSSPSRWRLRFANSCLIQ